ncbi:MAG: ADP-ribosylglycohydrolase family protein [Nostocaceae cyanobacterium]|nr:ADP-ribosylglycohydrolase family protein [Nostocaceae cyanobacterium]
MSISKQKSIVGCLLGTAVGDALGLPYEGLSKYRQRRLYPKPGNYNFLFGKGMISDDTEHTCMVAQSLIVSAGNLQIFSQQLAWRLQWWLVSLPAGIGYATLRSIFKLWLGFSPHNSGVFSAGNGTAMRSAIIGVCYGDNLPKLRELLQISTRITHTDPKSEYGALAVAIAAYLSSQKSLIQPQDYYQNLQSILNPEATEFLSLIKQACDSTDANESTELFAQKLGLTKGVSGYIYHTVPVVIQAWLKHQRDYSHGILEIIQCGGDTDTTAAILGGIIGAGVGENGIPQVWIHNLWEYPRSIKWIKLLGQRLAKVCEQDIPQTPLSLPIYAVFPRNLFFLLVVILHGLRRLLPPYTILDFRF